MIVYPIERKKIVIPEGLGPISGTDVYEIGYEAGFADGYEKGLEDCSNG